MFLNCKVTYTKDDEQKSKGDFIIFTQPPGVPGCKMSIRCFVRNITLKPLGNFMMGTVIIHGHKMSLSGSYGNDGLTCEVPDEIYQKGLELPKELYDAWNKGDGWNSAGNEAPLIRKWALENLKLLKR